MSDRDRPKRHGAARTPPAGVQAQIAGPVTENWDSLTPVHNVSLRPGTNADETLDQAIDRRSRETKNASLNTLNSVETLRAELSSRIDAADKKIDGIGEVVGDLRETVARTEGQNVLIIKMIDDQSKAREMSGLMRVTQTTAEVEIGKARQLSEIELGRLSKVAEIDDLKAKRELRRELIKSITIKVLAGVGAVWAVISVGLLSRCGG